MLNTGVHTEPDNVLIYKNKKVLFVDCVRIGGRDLQYLVSISATALDSTHAAVHMN